MNELQIEEDKIKKTLKLIEEVLTIEKGELSDLYKTFVGSREELWRIADRKKIHITNLETSLNKPYFARIDFKSETDDKISTIYIGKNGVSKNSDIIVTDWRAPISSLYYDASIGDCSYISPSGIIRGNMSLKRQFEIEKGQLLSYYDVDLVSNDTLLQKYLNDNNDNRLKSIVSTIQQEQNAVIREQLYDNIIVQGVAGSGKTTVALHRIAYLVYNYMKTISQSQYLVIGPNPVFIKYIKSVLPELDVSGVKQLTFEEFAKSYIEEDLNINDSSKKVNDSIIGKTINDIDKFKSSNKFKDMLDKFIEMYAYSITSNDLKIGDFVILNYQEITNIFTSINKNSNKNINNVIELVIEKICRYVEEHNDFLCTKYSEYSYQIFKEATTEEEKNKLRKKFVKERNEIKNNCRSTIRKYFSKSKLNTIKLYKLFISTIENYDIYKYQHLKELKSETLKNINHKSYDFEDLAALIYIKRLISPNRNYQKIKHVVIDEAQDLGEFNFIVLKETLPSATFSIFGDLAQSIYDYRGISSWQDINSLIFNNQGKIINFNKSYRTTSEIMSVADDVAQSISLGKSDLVVRHGNPVEFTYSFDDDEKIKHIINKIYEFKNKGYKTIAIISKTNEMSKTINEELAKRGLIIPNVSINDDLTDDKYCICTISNQLAKGLEFDAVIINDANEEIYSVNSSLDMKLLYVAITRALHEIDIVYTKKLTEPLLMNKFNDKKKLNLSKK